MLLFRPIFIAAFGLAFWAGGAVADVTSYCTAYARDTADAALGVTGVGTLAGSGNDQWTAENDRAMKSCLAVYGQSQPAGEMQQAQPAEVAGETDAAQATPAAEPQAAPAKPKPARVVKRGKPRMRLLSSAHAAPLPGVSPSQQGSGGSTLQPGSAAWNAYCARKYSSFDPATGNYKSYKGAARRCKVTRR